jgi:hypothetical protein
VPDLEAAAGQRAPPTAPCSCTNPDASRVQPKVGNRGRRWIRWWDRGLALSVSGAGFAGSVCYFCSTNLAWGDLACVMDKADARSIRRGHQHRKQRAAGRGRGRGQGAGVGRGGASTSDLGSNAHRFHSVRAHPHVTISSTLPFTPASPLAEIQTETEGWLQDDDDEEELDPHAPVRRSQGADLEALLDEAGERGSSPPKP